VSTEPKGLLFDMVQCIGCRNCVKACMESHDFPGDPEEVKTLSATAYTSDGDDNLFFEEFDEESLEFAG